MTRTHLQISLQSSMLGTISHQACSTLQAPCWRHSGLFSHGVGSDSTAQPELRWTCNGPAALLCQKACAGTFRLKFEHIGSDWAPDNERYHKLMQLLSCSLNFAIT